MTYIIKPHKHKIFDFDETISIEHTFAGHQLNKSLGTQINQYEIGKQDSKKNIKKGIGSIFKHGDMNLTAIATFHNNPDYIAGYVATLLNKELRLVKTVFSPTAPIIAINHYTVEGIDKPFLLSYLPHNNANEFSKTKAELKNKNKQIEFIRQTWFEEQLITRTTSIDLYEDDPKNYKAANQLHYVNGFQVEAAEEPEDQKDKVAKAKAENISKNFTLIASYKAESKNKIEPTQSASFERKLTLIRKKAQSLRNNGYEIAANAADELYTFLSKQFDALNFGRLELPEFKENCNQAIKQAHQELDKHRGWKEFLGNIAILILGLVVGLLAKGIINVANDMPFLFFAKTDSAQILDEATESLTTMTAVG